MGRSETVPPETMLPHSPYSPRFHSAAHCTTAPSPYLQDDHDLSGGPAGSGC